MAKPSTTNIVFLGRDITVDFHYYPATRGYRNSYGAPEEPDEDASVELERVMYRGRDITGILSDSSIEEIQSDILEM